MKTLKQILMFLIAFGMGMVAGNMLGTEFDMDSLSTLYNLTDYTNIIYDYFTE